MEHIYERLLEFTRDGVCRYTFSDGKILMVNQGWMDILELDGKPEDVVGKHIRELMVYTEEEGTIRRLLAKQGELHAFEYNFETLKGNRKWVMHDSFVATDDETGERIVEAITKNITFRRHALEQLEESEDRYRAVFGQASESIILVDPASGGMVDFNERAHASLGYTREEFAALTVYEVASSDSRAELRKCIERIAGGGWEPFELQQKTKNGDLRDVRVSARPVTIRGEVLVLSIWQDITETKQMEEVRRRSERLEAIGNLAGGVAHSFTNLMGVIRGYAASIADSLNPNAKAYTNARHILEAADHAVHLTKRLMSVSRISDNATEMQLKPVSLSQVIGDTMQLIEGGVASRNITIKVANPKIMPWVLADVRQLLDALMNLLLNAADAMPEGGTITIRPVRRHIVRPNRKLNPKAKPGDYVAIHVRDTGRGMDHDVLARVFDPFFSTKPQGAAFGLGLTVTQSIVQSWGGWVTASSREGVGSTFRLVIPEAKSAEGKKKTTAVPGVGGRMILVIDDRKESLAMMTSSLKDAGHIVHAADNVQKGVSLYKQHAGNIAVSIIDLVMPGEGGGAAMDAIFQHNPNANVIVLSGFSRDYVRRQIPTGAWTFLQKPFDSEQLVATVTEVIQPRATRI